MAIGINIWALNGKAVFHLKSSREYYTIETIILLSKDSGFKF
jgi:hypothetical protein